MSTEVKPQDQVTVSESSNGAVPEAGRIRVRPWRRRRYQATAIAAFAVLVALFGANNYLARIYTPEGAVRQYLSALQSGDSSLARGAIQVQSPTLPVALSLIDQSALRAALSAVRPDLKSFTVTGTTGLASGVTAVAITYETSGGTKQAKLLVQRSAETHFAIYSGWQVLIPPTILQINLPAGGGGLKIDGRPVALPAGKSTLAVLPVEHRLDFLASQRFTAQSLSLDDLFQTGQAVQYKPILTEGGLAQVKAAVKAGFVVCSQQTVPYRDPDSACPQSADASAVTGHWSVFGDATADLSVTFDGDLNAAAISHYQMVFSYQKSGLQRLPSGGAYSAPLTFSDASVTVGSISPATGVPALQRPAGASDDLAKSVVSKAMTQCAAITVTYTANCPQQAVAVEPTNLRWSMSGDPVASATVSFDGSTGIFTVQGSLAMTASFKAFGQSQTQNSLSTAYNAYLLWDGQTLQLITIVGES